jgi:glycosyltransferase involved in cell wall biosynthesis
VATAVGGIPEVVEHDRTGLLAPAGDVGALTEAVNALLGDAERRRAMGLAAQRRARERFSTEKIVTRYEELYRRVCGGEVGA